MQSLFWLQAKPWREKEITCLRRQGTVQTLLGQWEEVNDEDVLSPESCCNHLASNVIRRVADRTDRALFITSLLSIVNATSK